MPRTDDLLEFTRDFARTLTDAPDRLTGAQVEEMEIVAREQAELEHARRAIEDSYLPGWKAFAIEAGADIVSPIARLIGQSDYADRMNRFAEKVEQAASERDEQGWAPAIIKRGIRGAGRSLVTMVPAAAATGGYGAIAIAAGQETNRAFTEGKDAGLSGRDLAGFVVAQGVMEGAPAAVMQRIGFGGVEKLLAGKKAVSAGVVGGLKRLGITAVQELPEELFTEIGHATISQLAGVEDITSDSLKRLVADTTVQTIITVGMSHAITAGKPGQEDVGTVAHRIMDSVGQGKDPSRKDWSDWGLPSELGETEGQRKALVGELSKLIASDAVEQPTVAAEAVLGPEGVETPPEALGALEEPVEPARLLDPQEGDDEYVSLSKQGGIQIREAAGLEQQGEEAAETFDTVMAKVIADKADEGAVQLAETVLAKKRMTTASEHTAMVLKAWKLMDTLETVQADMAEAKEVGSDEAYERAEKAAEIATKELDTLTAAERFARREVARSLSIGQLRLSRESFDVADMLNKLQVRKGQARPTTETEQKQITKLSRQHKKVNEELAAVQAQIRSEEETLAKIKAEKIVAANKPKKGLNKTYGQKLKERATRDREDIKKQIRQMGLRVNDITGLAPEAVYLIGRLAVSYVKTGVGSLTDLVQQMRIDMPDLNLSNIDVYEALNAKDPVTQGKEASETSLRLRKLKSLAAKIVRLNNKTIGAVDEIEGKPPVSKEMIRLRKMETELDRRIRLEEQVVRAREGETVEAKARLKDSPMVAALKKELADIRKLQKAEKKVQLARKGIFPPKKSKAEVTTKLKGLQKEYTKLRLEFFAADLDAAKLARAVQIVDQLQEQIANGLTNIKEAPKEIPPQLKAVREHAQQLRREVRVDEELKSLKRQMETGEFEEKIVREKKPIDDRLAKKQIELARVRKEFNQMLTDAAPKTAYGRVKEIAALAKSIKATADLSFTMRQNVWQVFAHPVRASKAFFPAMRAFVSENSAEEIYNTMVNGPNGFLYAKSGLAVLDASSPDAQQRSEVFRSNVLERSKIPILKQFGAIMKMSSRHAVAVGNLIRTSAFDAFLDQNSNATPQELAAFADYVNVTTGLGNLGKAGAIAEELNLVFFSPKFAISRIQTPLALKKHWKQPRVRKAIARDMVRFALTGSTVLTLAMMAGFDVEWRDPDDPDWGKIRIGDTRVDIWGGVQQPMRVVFRTASIATGKSDIDPVEIMGRFVSYKLAPIITLPVELARKETAVGEKVEPLFEIPYTERLNTAFTALAPLVLEDMWEAWQRAGPGAGLATGALATLGVGVATYPDSQTAVRRKLENYRARGWHAKANALKAKWNRRNPKRRIVQG